MPCACQKKSPRKRYSFVPEKLHINGELFCMPKQLNCSRSISCTRYFVKWNVLVPNNQNLKNKKSEPYKNTCSCEFRIIYCKSSCEGFLMDLLKFGFYAFFDLFSFEIKLKFILSFYLRGSVIMEFLLKIIIITNEYMYSYIRYYK